MTIEELNEEMRKMYNDAGGTRSAGDLVGIARTKDGEVMKEDVTSNGRKKAIAPLDNDPTACVVVRGAGTGELLLLAKHGVVGCSIDNPITLGATVGAQSGSYAATIEREGLGVIASVIGGAKVRLQRTGEQ